MRTTVDMDGFPELVIARAIDIGIAKTKNEVIRMGVISLNKEFNLVAKNDTELEMVAKKIKSEKADMKKHNQKYINAKSALSKYNHLLMNK